MIEQDERRAFLERHPDVTSEELDRLVGARVRWRRLVVALVVALLVVVTAASLGAYRVHVVATREAPRVAGEIAAERQADVERRVDARTAELRGLLGDFFTFLADGLAQNPTLLALKREWESASENVDLVLTDLANLRSEPVSASESLWSNGRARIEAVVAAAARMALAVQEFVPVAVASMSSARATLDGDTDFVDVMDAMESALAPLIDDDPALGQRWAILRNRFAGWKAKVEIDVGEVRKSMGGEALFEAFLPRLLETLW